MFKSLQNKRFLALAVLLATSSSMTLVAASVGSPAEVNGEPNYVVVGNSNGEGMVGVGPGPVEVFSTEEIEALVAPVALYPDELLAIVLPAATYPLQIVQAARFLKELEQDDSLQPNEAWDESVVALLNYPEVIDLLNNDLEWTGQLGEAVVNQESEVIEAVEAFRDRAVLAGNLATDEHQIVDDKDGTIEIRPADPEVIYVPYYEPERVIVYQPYEVYHYYPRPYPVYYYPYPVDYHFSTGFFWGITTAFTIGWHSHHLNVHLWDYYSHPFYGRSYYYDNHYYHRTSRHHTGRRHAGSRRHVGSGRHGGDRWRPGRRHGARPGQRHLDADRNRGDNFAAGSAGSRSGSSRFERPGTFRPRPGFRGNMNDAVNQRTYSADGSRGNGSPGRTTDAWKSAQHDKVSAYKAPPPTAIDQQNRRPSNRVGRAGQGLDQERHDRRNESFARNRSRDNRLNRSAESKTRISKPVVPPSRSRPENRSDRNRVVRASRPEPAVSNASRRRVPDAVAYSGGRDTRPVPLPRQSRNVNRPVQNRPPPSRSQQGRPPQSPPQQYRAQSRSAPAVAHSSPPSRSEHRRGGSNGNNRRSHSNGNRGNSHRAGRVRRQ